jgi:hypothetical protein
MSPKIRNFYKILSIILRISKFNGYYENLFIKLCPKIVQFWF